MGLFPSQLYSSVLFSAAAFSLSSSHKALVHIFGRTGLPQKGPAVSESIQSEKEHKHCDVPIPRTCILSTSQSYHCIVCVSVHVHVLFFSTPLYFDCATIDVLFQIEATEWVYYMWALCYIMGVPSTQWQNCSIIASWPPPPPPSLPHSVALPVFSPSTCFSLVLPLSTPNSCLFVVTWQWYWSVWGWVSSSLRTKP